MKIYRYIETFILALAVFSISSCHKGDLISSGADDEVMVLFTPQFNGYIGTRAIGDASGIDRLKFAVYEIKGGTPSLEYHNTAEDWNPSNSLGITLLKGKKYRIIFWAENSNNSAYDFNPDNGTISADYSQYKDGGFAKMEQLDAFYAVSDIESAATTTKTIMLTRPVAQLNFADKTQPPVSGTHKTEVTYTGIPTGFNLLTESIESYSFEPVIFTFYDYTSEVLDIESTNYYYVATNYIFAPTSISASVELKTADGSSTINSFEFTGNGAIPLEKNMKTNILGSIVQQPQQWSVWDGTIPAEHSLILDSQNRYIIDEAADIAWLSENGRNLPENSSFVQTVDIDMDNKEIESIKLPGKSSYDGGNKTIKNYKNSLFGDVTELRVHNINIENFTVQGVSHTGVLVNTLKGSSSFNNVTVSNSSVKTTSGAAGGMVGYIVRKSQNDRGESLEVTFSDCEVNGIAIDGFLSEGYYVGLLRGYDNGEILTFNDNCTVTLPQTASAVSDFVSPYMEGNEGAWMAENNYTKFNGWLGNEECYRGTVMYGSNRFIPCWDGKTKIAPLTDGTTKLIYSAFDLANLQGTAAGNIKLMENVDMEHDSDGASKDGVRNHIFKALSTLTKLDGNGKTIYNITIRDNYYGGFVKSESCSTTFENVTFDGADIRVTHDTEEGNAYVGTLRGFAYAATTINNVHVKNGYLNGVCKIGGLCGGIFSKITCSNSTVSNYSIENYDSQIISAGFKANGEIGGLIGYITVLDANTVNEISNCSVSDNNFNCVTYSASLWDRSVAPFIGDIRTQQAGTVKINNCKILGTNTYTNASNGKTATFDQHRKKTGGSFFKPTYTYYPLVGQCYDVIILDKKGQVYIDDTQIN